MKKVTEIETTVLTGLVKKKLRVAAYCRVSTASEEQMESLAAQKEHYEKYIKENPDEVYKMAAEETGISEDNVVKMIDWYDFNPTITQKDIDELEKTQEFLIKNDMLKQPINISDIVLNK